MLRNSVSVFADLQTELDQQRQRAEKAEARLASVTTVYRCDKHPRGRVYSVDRLSGGPISHYCDDCQRETNSSAAPLQPQPLPILIERDALQAEVTRLTAHNEHSERWQELMALKKPDAIGRAFSLLEESILHHNIERDGWTPDDTCYMETTQEARKLIEAKATNLRQKWIAQNYELEQILGKALGRPWFKDDQVSFPGATEADGVLVAVETVEDLAAEAATKLAEVTRLKAALIEVVAALREAGRGSVTRAMRVDAPLRKALAALAAEQQESEGDYHGLPDNFQEAGQ